MTDRERIRILTEALETLASAEMGIVGHARAYEEQVKEIARNALAETRVCSPQD